MKRIVSVLLMAAMLTGLCWAKKKTSNKVYDVALDNVRTLEDVKALLKRSNLDEMTVRLQGMKILSIEELTNPYDNSKGKFAIICRPENEGVTVNIEVTKFLFSNPMFEKNLSPEKLYDITFTCAVEEPVSKAKSKLSKAASTVTFGMVNSKESVEYQTLIAKDVCETVESVEEKRPVVEPETKVETNNTKETVFDPAKIDYKEMSCEEYCRLINSESGKKSIFDWYAKSKGYKLTNVHFFGVEGFGKTTRNGVEEDFANFNSLNLSGNNAGAFVTDFLERIGEKDSAWLDRFKYEFYNRKYNGHYTLWLYTIQEGDLLSVVIHNIEGVPDNNQVAKEKADAEKRKVMAEKLAKEYRTVKYYKEFRSDYYNKKICIEELYVMTLYENEHYVMFGKKVLDIFSPDLSPTTVSYCGCTYTDDMLDELKRFKEEDTCLNIYITVGKDYSGTNKLNFILEKDIQ